MGWVEERWDETDVWYGFTFGEEEMCICKIPRYEVWLLATHCLSKMPFAL